MQISPKSTPSKHKAGTFQSEIHKDAYADASDLIQSNVLLIWFLCLLGQRWIKVVPSVRVPLIEHHWCLKTYTRITLLYCHFRCETAIVCVRTRCWTFVWCLWVLFTLASTARHYWLVIYYIFKLNSKMWTHNGVCIEFFLNFKIIRMDAMGSGLFYKSLISIYNRC